MLVPYKISRRSSEDRIFVVSDKKDEFHLVDVYPRLVTLSIGTGHGC